MISPINNGQIFSFQKPKDSINDSNPFKKANKTGANSDEAIAEVSEDLKNSITALEESPAVNNNYGYDDSIEEEPEE